MKPSVFLLCGLPGSGKTTYAKKLEQSGAIRYTLDEEVFKRFGRHFEDGYDEKEAQTKAELRDLCTKQVMGGKFGHPRLRFLEENCARRIQDIC